MRRSSTRCLKAYETEPFLQVLPFRVRCRRQRDIAGSNFCHLGVIGDRIPGRAVVVAVLDNLTKGSSGQAIQNANLMLGLPGGGRVDAGAGLSVRAGPGRPAFDGGLTRVKASPPWT